MPTKAPKALELWLDVRYVYNAEEENLLKKLKTYHCTLLYSASVTF